MIREVILTCWSMEKYLHVQFQKDSLDLLNNNTDRKTGKVTDTQSVSLSKSREVLEEFKFELA